MDLQKVLEGTENLPINNDLETDLVLQSLALELFKRPFDIATADRWIDLMTKMHDCQLVIHLRTIFLFRNLKPTERRQWTDYLFQTKERSDFIIHQLKKLSGRISSCLNGGSETAVEKIVTGK